MKTEDERKVESGELEPLKGLDAMFLDMLVCDIISKGSCTEDEKETKILEGKGENIIKFPKEKIEGTDSVPKYYICDKPGYPYPGLQPNKFKGTI